MTPEDRLMYFAGQALNGLLAEPENPYINTALEELCEDLPADTKLSHKLAFAACEIAEAINEEWEFRCGKTTSNECGAGSPNDPACGQAPSVGRGIPPIAFASGD